MNPLTYLLALPDRLRYTAAEDYLYDVARLRLDVEPGTDAHAGYTRQWAKTSADLALIGLRLKRRGVAPWDFVIAGREAVYLAGSAALATASVLLWWVAR